MTAAARAVSAMLALLVACEGEFATPDDDDLAALEQAASSPPAPGTTPTPGPTCSPSHCFETSASVPPQYAEPALRARSVNWRPALSAYADAGGMAAQLTASLGTALRASAGGDAGRAVDAWAGSTTGATRGLRARVQTATGAAADLAHFTPDGGSRLLTAANDWYAAPFFHVTAAGEVYQQGVEVPAYGAKGPQGDKGPTGNAGPPGPTGNKGPAGDRGPTQHDGHSLAVCSGAASSCIGLCPGATITSSAAGPCNSNAQTGSCSAGQGGVCCVCDP